MKLENRLAVVILIVFILMAICNKLYVAKIRKANEVTQQKAGIFQEFILNIVDNHEAILSYNIDRLLNNKFIKIRTDLYKSKKRVGILSVSHKATISVINTFLLLGSIYYFSYLAINNIITIGTITVFISLISKVSKPLKEIFIAEGKYQETLANWDRVLSILNIKYVEESNTQDKYLLKQVRKVSFNNIHHKYDKNNILEDADILLEKGKLYSIVGDSGSGKTTLIKILL